MKKIRKQIFIEEDLFDLIIDESKEYKDCPCRRGSFSWFARQAIYEKLVRDCEDKRFDPSIVIHAPRNLVVDVSK